MRLPDVLPQYTERAWSHAVDRLARMFGWRWWHDAAVNQRTRCRKSTCGGTYRCDRCHEPLRPVRNVAGWPDRVLVRGDRLIFVELKSDRGRLTTDQQDWLTALMAVRRVQVFVFRPRDVEKVTEILR